jgi:predicted Zn-dependent protease
MMETLVEAERALTHGQLDQAERLYRTVASSDPKNSIAVMGLARVALERGDDAAALGHARAALVIDPQNPAAQHLVMRLGEVFAGRGEAEPAVELPPEAGEKPAAPARGTADAGTRAPGLVGRLLGRKRGSR